MAKASHLWNSSQSRSCRPLHASWCTVNSVPLRRWADSTFRRIWIIRSHLCTDPFSFVMAKLQTSFGWTTSRVLMACRRQESVCKVAYAKCLRFATSLSAGNKPPDPGVSGSRHGLARTYTAHQDQGISHAMTPMDAKTARPAGSLASSDPHPARIRADKPGAACPSRNKSPG